MGLQGTHGTGMQDFEMGLWGKDGTLTWDSGVRHLGTYSKMGLWGTRWTLMWDYGMGLQGTCGTQIWGSGGHMGL